MRIRRVVDLSLALDADTQIYPGDPPVVLRQHSSIAADGFNLLDVAMGSQSGTNCDAPYHFLESGARIDEVPLELCAGPGVLIDVRAKMAREPITIEDVRPYLDRLGPGVIVVLHTGWSRFYRQPDFFDHPYLDARACQLLLEHGVRTFCLDALNIDETPDASHPGSGFPVHQLIAQAGGVVVENLTALEQIDFPDPLITVFPLRLTGADGAPTRACALELEI
jgi:kynurenine formamidase